MGVFGKLESDLNRVFTKQVPFQMPESARKSLAGVLWVVTLVVGVLQVLAAISLWRAGEQVNRWVEVSNHFSRLYGDGHATSSLGLFFYLTLVLLIVHAVLLLLASVGLRQFSKPKGWDYLFYALLLSFVGGVARIFSSVGGGFGSFLGVLVGTAIGAYLLFQVRSYFKSGSTAVKNDENKPASDSGASK